MTDQTSFSEAIIKRIGYYVYRLVDPRNEETFYVGKGIGNRVFDHIKGEIRSNADAISEKIQRIRDIRSAGSEVIHLIHRHGMNEETAFEVESALIDAYPDTNNIVSGHASDERGLMTSNEIILRYDADKAVFHHSAIIINIGRLIKERDCVYDAVKYAWRINVNKARSSDVVLAVDRGIIIGVFIAERWMEATINNFPDEKIEFPKRWGFSGYPAPAEITKLYLDHRIPDYLRKKGAANPIRYVPGPRTSKTHAQ